MATFKHISSKNADYGAAEQYLTFEHDEFTMKPTLDEAGRLILREDYRIATLNCGDEDFAVACMRANLRYGKNQKREDVKSHHYIISFDPRDAADNGLTVDRAQALGEEFCAEHFPGHQAIVCTHPDGHNHSGNIHVHIVINDDAIVLLESMPDGILYSNILLKLYLKSLKNGGKLQLDENIPYTAQMIATLTRQQVGTVERALGIFQQLGLVEQLHGGLLYMTDIELMIGQSSTEAERKRAARLANKALPPPRTNGGHLSDIRPPEIEIKKEIDIEIEKERELETGQAPARSYGRYNNVFLSDTELDELKAELPDKWEYYIDRLSTHIASKGTKYRSHAATIYKWAQEDEAKKPPKKGIPDYTFKEGESL